MAKHYERVMQIYREVSDLSGALAETSTAAIGE